MKIQFPGIGAVSIGTDKNNILIDAFNDYNKSPAVKNGDLILFTHDDADHFSPGKLPDCIQGMKIKIIGPPSISYPLLASGRIKPGLLNIVYPPHLTRPVKFNADGIGFTVYQTRHFIDWEPVHISYLLEIDDKKIYITGDSSILANNPGNLSGLDVLIMSFIDKGFVEKTCSEEEALKRHIYDVKRINRIMSPYLILGNHLINCSWSVGSRALEKSAKEKHVKNMKCLHSDEEFFEI